MPVIMVSPCATVYESLERVELAFSVQGVLLLDLEISFFMVGSPNALRGGLSLDYHIS